MTKRKRRSSRRAARRPQYPEPRYTHETCALYGLCPPEGPPNFWGDVYKIGKAAHQKYRGWKERREYDQRKSEFDRNNPRVRSI